jgi:1A family penicillin-binding protein
MAKQQQTRTNRRLSGLETATRAASWVGTGLTQVWPWTRDRTSDLRALFGDTGRFLRRILRAGISPRARLLYLSTVLALVLTGTVVTARSAIVTMQKYNHDLSDPNIIMNKKKTGVTILDRNGEVLFQGYGATDRRNVSLNEVPKSMINATLAAEDANFYHDGGFSWQGTGRAFYQDVRHKSNLQGGSTITQQLVKNTLLTSEKSYSRKFSEIILSIELDHRYNKDQILQMYLNSIYYGQGAYGVQAAAQTYFHKNASELTLDESALLAGLPQSPSVYDPNVNPAAAQARRDYVLHRMQSLGYIEQHQANLAAVQPIQTSTKTLTIKAPWFDFYVLDNLRKQYGNDLVEHGGITVKTSLDYKKQQVGEQAVEQQISNLASHHVTNGGLVSVDPKNGDILSMVGSVDYGNPEFGNVNVTLAPLQPGSSFKPFAYVTAFEKGWNGSTIVQDKPVAFPQANGSPYIPHDYDLKWRGPVTLRRALANSLNIPAIEVLEHAGIPDTISTASSLGITSLGDPSQYGLSLVLGAANVSPLQLATAYSAFAADGRTIAPRGILEVKDRMGKNITKPEADHRHQAFDPRLAYMITNILSDNGARAEEFGPHSPLELSRPAAAKTGTTNDFRDNWTIGYTPDLVTAVWVGNNDHSPMQNVDGITGAAPIWHNYMESVLADTPVHNFAQPAGLIAAKVCAADGGLVDNSDPRGTTELFLAESPPTKHCGSASPPVLQLVTTSRNNLPTQTAAAPAQEPIGRGGAGNQPPTPTPVPQPNPGPGPNPGGKTPNGNP